MISLSINGTQITNFILSTPFKDTIDEELDQLNFQIKSTTRLTLNKNDKVEYSINHGNHNVLSKVFCLFEAPETWEGEFWLYQVSCLSATKILENIVINGMAETYPVNNGLFGQMERVRAKINAQSTLEYGVGNGIIIYFDNVSIASSGIDSVVASVIDTSDFLWDGQVNAREIFNDMLDKADALIIAYDYTLNANNGIDKIYLKAVKRNKTGKSIIITNDDVDNGGLQNVSQVVKGITYNRNSEFACGNIISLIKNGVAKDNVQQAYLPARNSDLTIDEASKWHIITQEPIYSLNKVYLLANIYNCGMRVYENGSTKYTIYGGITITGKFDITSYIVEKSVFDNMSLAGQSKHLYFIRGQKGIFGLYDRYKSGQTGLFSNTAMENIINDLNNLVQTNTQTPLSQASFYDSDYFGFFNTSGDSYSTFTKETSNTNITGNTNYQNYGSVEDINPSNIYYGLNWNNETTLLYTSDMKRLLFSVNYQPYCDSVVKIEKTNLEESHSKNLSVLKNQSDRTIDATKYYDSQESIIKRMGNKEMFIYAIVDLNETYSQYNTLWDLGDYFEIKSIKWKITQREFNNYGSDKLKVKYTFSKEYNASNVDIQINRDKRLYGIPLSQYVDRYVIVKNANAKYIDKIAIRSYDDFTGGTTTQGYNIMEMIKLGNSNITDRVARCYDNYAVDIERTKYNSTIVNVYTRYCNTDGYALDIIAYGLTNAVYNSLPCSDYSRLPFKPNADGGSDITSNGYNISLHNVYKDKMERIIIIVKE